MMSSFKISMNIYLNIISKIRLVVCLSFVIKDFKVSTPAMFLRKA